MRPQLVPTGTEPGARTEVNRMRGLPDGRFPCACWCEAGYVVVSHADLLDGRTYSCGREGCTEHRRAA
jgi:hypothetical protein